MTKGTSILKVNKIQSIFFPFLLKNNFKFSKTRLKSLSAPEVVAQKELQLSHSSHIFGFSQIDEDQNMCVT